MATQRLPSSEEQAGAWAEPAEARRSDPVLMAGGALAAAAGAIAYSSLSVPWVHARIVDANPDANPLSAMTFRGTDSIGGPVVSVLAIALGLLGLLWFWFGLDRSARVPTIAHPASALVVALIAGVIVVLAGIGSVMWHDAFVTYARDVGSTKRAMQGLLDAQPSPTIAVERLGGVLRLGAAGGLALVAGLVAWWAQHRRY